MVRQAATAQGLTPAEDASKDAPKATGRGRPRKPPEQSESVADLIKAIQWIDVAQRDDQLRPVYETHSRVFQGWIIATDGTITAGHRIALDGDFAPNTAKLLAALSKAGANLSMTYQDGRLALTSKGFRCAVPCLAGSTVQCTYPAPQMGPAHDGLSKALGSVGRMVKSSGQTVLETSVMLTGYGTALATDRQVALEAYHGVQMPEVIVPQPFVRIVKGKEGLTAIGITSDGGHLTFWYGDDAFISTAIYGRDQWPPSFAPVWDGFDQAAMKDVPKGLAEAVQAVAPHNDRGGVYVFPKEVTSAADPTAAEAIADCKSGVKQGLAFGSRSLSLALGLATSWQWHDRAKAFFLGENVRGAVVTRNENVDDDKAPIGLTPEPEAAPVPNGAGGAVASDAGGATAAPDAAPPVTMDNRVLQSMFAGTDGA